MMWTMDKRWTPAPCGAGRDESSYDWGVTSGVTLSGSDYPNHVDSVNSVLCVCLSFPIRTSSRLLDFMNNRFYPEREGPSWQNGGRYPPIE